MKFLCVDVDAGVLKQVTGSKGSIAKFCQTQLFKCVRVWEINELVPYSVNNNVEPALVENKPDVWVLEVHSWLRGQSWGSFVVYMF